MTILIIGGGITGLSIGWTLAREARAATILERGETGYEATWASAGMLAPHVHAAPGADPLARLVLDSHRLWPDFAHALEDAAGMRIGYRTRGSLLTAFDADGMEGLKRHADLQHEWGIGVRWLSGDEAREIEPQLAPEVMAAVFSAIDHQVDNRLAAEALRTAFIQAGGALREHNPVTEIVIEEGAVRGVRVDREVLDADTVVLAAGAWSAGIAGLPEEARPPVRPMKGQMIAVQMPRDAPLIRHLVWGRDVYLVPRLDGRLLIGATVEDVGFDKRVTAGAMLRLLRSAVETIPAIADLPIQETWAGLRPGSRDDSPILGTTPVRGLIVATGHFAHGIVLAPITAQAISHLILRGETPEAIAGFGMGRFGG